MEEEEDTEKLTEEGMRDVPVKGESSSGRGDKL